MKQQKFFQNLRIVLFAAFLIGGCVVGFVLPLRPEVSETENRELAEFPAWDLEAFVDGRYTSDVSLWYSDTFPFRDTLLSWNTGLRGFYGIKRQSASSEGVGDTIDTDGDFVWQTDPPSPETGTGPAPETDPEPETTPPPATDHEVIKGYLVDGIKGFELYYFNRQNSDRYARSVVQTALDLDGRAQVYVMVTPMSYAYGVSKDTQNDLNVSDCKDAIDWMYNAIKQYGKSAGLGTPVIPVDAYNALLPHKDEYIFFRTDHHWTALGAHYASRAFLDTAGLTYPALDDESSYREMAFDGFTGSLAGHTKHENPALVNNPDTIHAYVPQSVNTVSITDRDGNVFEKPIVNPDGATLFSASQRYRLFVDGDYPLSVVHNEKVTDGSAILLIKESYGNAFIPMLVDSYEYVYAIDYRFFRTMSVSDMVETYGITTVLFLNNPVATSADYNIGCLEKLVAIKSKIEP